MEKKNTLLLTVIAVATLLVAVVGATFAFFTATQDVENQLTVNATTGTVASFQSTATDTIAFTVTGSDMLAGAVNETEPKGMDNATMTVTLSGDEGSTCTYDIEYKDTSAEAYVQQIAKEFTLEGASTPEVSNAASEVLTMDVTNYSTFADQTAKKVVTDAVITVDSTGSVNHVWNFTAKFYNMNGDQTKLADKTYTGYFQVTNVRC